MSAHSAVFLDRDGTLIEEVGYLDRVDRVELYPWSIDAVRLLNRAGLRVIAGAAQTRADFTGRAARREHLLLLSKA